MKKRAQLLLVIIFILTLVPSSAIFADDDTTTSSEPSHHNTETAIEDDTKATDYTKKLQERLEKRKQTVKANATKAQEARIKIRCKGAQGFIMSVSSKAKQSNTTRVKVYGTVVDRLTSLSTSLKNQGADTTELDAKIEELKTLVAKFETSMTNLRQEAADLANMDCAADPAAFKASLEALRISREAVAEDSKAIRAFVKDTIKPILQTIKQSLESTTTTEGSNQ